MYGQNMLCKVAAACEAVAGFRLRSVWAHTCAQAADSGTRPTETGSLEIGPVQGHSRGVGCYVGRNAGVRSAGCRRSMATPSVHPRGDFNTVMSPLQARKLKRHLLSNAHIYVWFTVDATSSKTSAKHVGNT